MDETKKKILVVEDERNIANLLSYHVKKAGYDCDVAYDGKTGLDMALEGGYDLPITSYIDERIDKSKMGRMGDFSLLEYESVYPAVPTINLSGDDYRTQLWNAIMGYMDIDEAINDLNTRYNAAYDEDVSIGLIKRLVIEDYNPLQPSAGTVTWLDK